MADRETISHTIIVSPVEAFGYIAAGERMPEVSVEARVPATPHEVNAVVAEHVTTLVVENPPPPEDIRRFIAAATAEIRALFEDEDHDNVFVRLTTLRDDDAPSRFQALAALAVECRPILPE